jgi:outer membrane protein assembly factor BamA
MAILNTQYTFPIIPQVHGSVFYDIGAVEARPSDMANTKYRNVTGIGLTFIIPQFQVPLTLDFGWVLSKRSHDEKQFIVFDIARIF